MTEINNNELFRIAQHLTLVSPPFYPKVTDYLNDIYVTGCRAEEPLTITRWTWNFPDTDYVQLDPFKLSLPRTFKKEILSQSLLTAIENQIQPYDNLTLRQIEYSMRQVSSFGTASLEDRYIIAYLYRYYRVRSYLEDGKTQAQVNSLFGWNNPEMSTRYSSAKIYVTNYNIPAETYFISSANNDVIIDSNSDSIVSL